MTLDTRKSTKHGEGPKNVSVASATVPVVLADLFYLICFFDYLRKREERRERAFTPLKVLVWREVLLLEEGVWFLGKIIFRFLK